MLQASQDRRGRRTGGRAVTPVGGSVGMMLANPAASVEQYNEDADEIEGLRRQLAAARAALEEERHRNRWLYYAWLPSPTAQAIATGQPAPEAGRSLVT